MTEPWMRGPIDTVSPLLTPVLYSFQQAREDLAAHTAGLSSAQVWAQPFGLAALGFHLRHIAGSVDRLTTYLQGRQLTAEQLATLKAEVEPGESLEGLLADMDAAFRVTEAVIRAIDLNTLTEPRAIGRKQLPTTVNGLLVHLAEHTQRHVGQAISVAKLVRAI